MRILVAPERFAGTLTAAEAAAAIASGWAAAAPDDEIVELPLSNGGPGALDVLGRALGGERVPVVVPGPLGEPLPASVLVAGPAGQRTAYVEAAGACGLHLLPHPDAAGGPGGAGTTAGVGHLLAAALACGVGRVVVMVGGRCAGDAGAGALAALARPWPAEVDLVVATDTDATVAGDQAAASVSVTGREDLLGAPGAGAGAGLGAALLSLGARRVPGAQEVVDAVGVPAAAAAADLVVTGEGTFDWQSLRGSVLVALARAAQAAAVPTVVVAGQVMVGRRELSAIGVDAAYAVAGTPEQVAAAMADPGGTLAARAARVARTWSRRPG